MLKESRADSMVFPELKELWKNLENKIDANDKAEVERLI